MNNQSLPCKRCRKTFFIEQEDLLFLERAAPQIGKTKFSLPRPTLCPECRLQRRMAWRNERHIFLRTCSDTKARIVSAYPPDSEFPVTHINDWWKDANDGLTLGRAYDPGKSFVGQVADLLKVAPRAHVFTYSWDRQLNSDYCNCSGDLKDCYLIFGAARNERCMYSHYINDCCECLDCLFVLNSNECCRCRDLDTCQTLFFSDDCKNCYDSYFLHDCRGCSNCIGCVGLRQKQYCLYNEPVSVDLFLAEKRRLQSGAPEEFQRIEERYQELLRRFPRRYMHGDRNENSTGDFLWQTKNCYYCFDGSSSEDCRYCTWFEKARDCMDIFAWGEAELCYEIVSGGQDLYHCLFCNACMGSAECFYCDSCMYSKHCFGCVGLKHRQYCILNQQYSAEEYERLVPLIIEGMMKRGEWGEFFPAAISPFGYNYSVAINYFPLERDAAKDQGFGWSDYCAARVNAPKILNAAELPPRIDLVGDDVLDIAICCERSGKPFKITGPELEFYRRHHLSLPRLHPDERHLDRLRARNPRILHQRSCGKCDRPVLSTYADESPERVYCDPCYLEDVY